MGKRWTWAIACLVLVAIPFLAVDFIPSTDLPQHLGQLRLLAEAWANPDGALEIHWWTPYGLVYAFLALPWVILPPVAAGRVAVMLLVLLQVGALHLVAGKYDRPAAGAVLASAFVFHYQLYWGFLNFLFGWLMFLGWFALTRREESPEKAGWRTALAFSCVSGLLYLSHALWFATGVLWLCVEAAISRRSRRDLFWRAVGVAPMIVVAAYWYAFLGSSNFAGPPAWALDPLSRLLPKFVILASLGGLRHIVEVVVVAAALLWALAAIVARRKRPFWGCDPYFAALAVMFLAFYLILPDKFANTIQFSTRWLPSAFMSLLLAVGSPALRVVFRRLVPILVLASLMIVTTVYWQDFERTELSGLAESLDAMQDEPRVIGLSYLESSRFVNGRPFIQTFAWAYAVHGGELNFSFGYFAPSLVVYKDPQRVRWSWGLEWFPKNVRRSDFQYFDYALIGGDAAVHARMARVPELRPLTWEGLWRLYQVEARIDPPVLPGTDERVDDGPPAT